MTYHVTPAQYAKLIEAKDGWPKKLSLFWLGPFGDECAVAYLTRMAGLDCQEVEGSELSEPFKPEGMRVLSRAYGVPEHEIQHLYLENAILFITARRRSKRVLRALQRLLDKVELVREPVEVYEPEGVLV